MKVSREVLRVPLVSIEDVKLKEAWIAGEILRPVAAKRRRYLTSLSRRLLWVR
jgi:hypothetical protein